MNILNNDQFFNGLPNCKFKSNLIKTKTNISPKTILEIGSMHGHDANTLKNEFNLNDSDVWVVEPNPHQQDERY